MTMITPSYLGETIEYSSLHACRSTLEDPTGSSAQNYRTFICPLVSHAESVTAKPHETCCIRNFFSRRRFVMALAHKNPTPKNGKR